MFCRYFENAVCRSCSWLDRPYIDTIQRKVEVLKQLFPEAEVLAPMGQQQANGSRIRAKLAVFDVDGSVRFGFLDTEQRIVPVEDCPLHHPAINELVRWLPEIVDQCRLTPYSMTSDRGELKFVVITYSPTHQQMMVQLVLRSQEAVERLKKMWRTSDELRQRVTVFSANVQPVRSSTIQGLLEIPISEQTEIAVRYGTTEIFYRPLSFIQTNYQIAEQLYQASANAVHENRESILDLYCGTGAFSLTAACAETKVSGFDSASESIDCANKAAQARSMPDAKFFTASQIPRATLQDEGYGTIICNPPRRGLDIEIRELLKDVSARQLVYSSCNPETLQRDVRELAANWQLRTVQTFDMFPFTPHQEVLALLNRRS
ncbi:MAG: methyltransferase domain-containing protein [Planctomyces sp.]|nr:methyltransferase domain-containing protein [Planctomyces sp.]